MESEDRKESLYTKALKAKQAGLPNANLLAKQSIEEMENQGNILGAAYAAETLGMYESSMEYYKKIGNLEMAALMAKRAGLEERGLEFIKNAIELYEKKGDLSAAAKLAESAGLFEKAIGLYCEDCWTIGAIKLAKKHGLEELLKRVCEYAIEDFSMEGDFKYAAYAALAIDQNEKFKELFIKAIKTYEDKGEILYSFVLTEIADLPHPPIKDYESSKEPIKMVLSDSLDCNTNREIKDIFDIEIMIQESFGLIKLANKTKRKLIKFGNL